MLASGSNRMRARLVLPAILVVLPALAGCLEGSGHASWDEPALPAWLNENGEAAGFRRFDPEGLAFNGHALESSLPEGARLTTAEHRNRDNTNVIIHADSVLVQGSVQRATDDTVQDVDGVLGLVYRGDPTKRTAAMEEFRRAWDTRNGTRFDPDHLYVALDLAGPWNFDDAVTTPLEFVPNKAPGGSRAQLGDWSFEIGVTRWYLGKYDGDETNVGLHADAMGHVARLGKGENVQDVQDNVRRQVPGFEWTFHEFEYERSHVL